MPIYDYRCSACGFQKDVLQKLADPVLTTCPSCSKETFAKQLTAPGFQLTGSGWYATDFKGGGATSPAKSSSEPKSGGETSSGNASSGGSGPCGGSCACH